MLMSTPQFLVQLPQCWESVVVSTQKPLQRMWGLMQVKPHCMLLQTGMALAGAGQTLPQVSQFEVLVARSTHEPLQFDVGPGQAPVQVPPLRTSPVQTVGHVPQ